MSRIVASAACGIRVAARCRRVARLVGAAAIAALVTAPAAVAADPPSTLILQLNGPAEFEYAGYFAALWKGLYDKAGLTVEIRPASTPGSAAIDPVHEIVEGHAQFGIGTMNLVVHAAQGLPLLLLAPIFQGSGTAVYYRADSDFASPGELIKARVGRFPASSSLDIELDTALRGEGIAPSAINPVPLAPGQTVAALADHRVDVAIGSAWQVPWQALARNLALKSFDPASYRVEFYGDTLFTSARFARDHPAVVRRFRDASLEGWAYALDHPDEIAARLVAELPPPPGIADPLGFAHYQADVARRLSRYPAVKLGHSSLERWDRIEMTLVDAGAVVRTADPDSFVYDPAEAAREATDGRDFSILGIVVLVIVAVTAALLWRRRVRPRTPAEPALAVPSPSPPPPDAAAPADMPPLPEPPPPLPPLPAQTADLNAVLTPLEAALRARVPAGIAFRLSLLPELWPCRSDSNAVAELVAVLVAIICADLKPGDTVVVGTRNIAFDADSVAEFAGARIGEFARITVRDNGAGLSEADIERIFDPDATPHPAVAAARPVMDPLGGFVRIESAREVGTAIHLYFPRLASEMPAAAAPAKPAEPPPHRHGKPSAPRTPRRRSRPAR